MRRVRHCHKVCSLFGTVSALHMYSLTKMRYKQGKCDAAGLKYSYARKILSLL